MAALVSEAVEALLRLDPEDRAKAFRRMPRRQRRRIFYSWNIWARPEQVWRPDYHTYYVYLAGRGWGKALALDTPIPTPTGWTTMGDLRVGDLVLDEHGRACSVTFATEVQYGRTCYDVVFDDGSVVTADAEHRWLTWDKRARKAHGRARNPKYGPEVRTTVEILATLMVGKERNHAVQVTRPLCLRPVELPIDPYVLGVWLGDGDSASSTVTAGDMEICGHIESSGEPCTNFRTDPRTGAIRFAVGAREKKRDDLGRMTDNGSLHSRLRSAGLLRNKHIPDAYLRASEPQRMALLQGLMDTDGHISTNGQCEFCSTNTAIADGALELALSLGFKATMHEGRSKLDGQDCGPKYRIRFMPRVQVFRLKRKRDRLPKGRAQSTRTRFRYIAEVRERPSVPVRCITVDSPSSLFLCGRSMIPTHNTRVGAEAVRYVAENPELCGGRKRRGPGDLDYGRGGVIGIAGRTANDVNQTMLYGPSGIMTISPPWFRPVHHKSEKILEWPHGLIARLMSGDVPDSFRGPNFGFLWGDEVPHWSRATESWNNAQLALRHGEHPRAIITTTPLGTAEIVKMVFSTDKDGHPLPDPTTIDGYKENPDAKIVRGSTYDNVANLASSFLTKTVTQYEGTDLGEQELYGRVVLEIRGAIWRQGWFVRCELEELPELRRVVLAVDPATSDDGENAETGLVVAAEGEDGLFYLLEDGSGDLSPDETAKRVVQLCQRWGVDEIIEEDNNGGEWIRAVLQHHVQFTVPIEGVKAHKSKEKRARMVAPTWQFRRVVHVGDSRRWRHLEWQMTHWDPHKPRKKQLLDRMDAAVWALIRLRGDGDDRSTLRAMGDVGAWELIREKMAQRAGEAPRARNKRRKRRRPADLDEID